VAQVNVQVGDTIKAGQVVMTLDTTDLQLALKRAQATLSTAQANADAASPRTGRTRTN
jgi:multidrug resistance efflux pump